jgi:8-oxo-dGTP pyrophosphatase MutT (NUDIX family)
MSRGAREREEPNPPDDAVNARVREFLSAHPAHCELREDWPLDPVAPLLARLCLASSLPPLECTSSILAIVTRSDGVVLFINPAEASGTIAHVLFGGRSEPGESPEETLRREVAEETGWQIEPTKIVGFRHFRHLGPPHAEMADRPYPEFVQPVYAATARAFDAALLLPGEHPCEFVDAHWAISVTDPDQRPLLRAALEATRLRQDTQNG